MLELRPATPADLKCVGGWIQNRRDAELWAGWRVGFPLDFTSLGAAIDFAEDNAFSLLSDQQLVAFGQLLRKPSKRGHLGRIIVNPDLSGKGYGEKLVRALLDRARQAGMDKVSLQVDVSNPAAVALYVKLGFRDMPRPPDEPEAPGSRYMELMFG